MLARCWAQLAAVSTWLAAKSVSWLAAGLLVPGWFPTDFTEDFDFNFLFLCRFIDPPSLYEK